jgi:hypothetical protein
MTKNDFIANPNGVATSTQFQKGVIASPKGAAMYSFYHYRYSNTINFRLSLSRRCRFLMVIPLPFR